MKNDLMEKIVSLCKRRGFIFPGSEIYPHTKQQVVLHIDFILLFGVGVYGGLILINF